MVLHHLKALNDMATYSLCDNIYTICSMKSNIDHEMDPLHLKLKWRGSLIRGGGGVEDL